MIIAHGKHGDEIYDSALELIKERLDQGWYGEDDGIVENAAKRLIATENEVGGRDFLLSRRNFEYEGITIRDDYVKKT